MLTLLADLALSSFKFSLEFGNAIPMQSLTSISGLNCGCSPSAIAGHIVSIHVDPIKSVLFGWLWTEIVQKVFERMPASTHFYAATAVTAVSRAVRVSTPRKHVQPTIVCWRFVGASGITMCRASELCDFALSATARLRLFGTKVAAVNDSALSAGALAKPSCVSTQVIRGAFNNAPSSKTSACDIYEVGHRTGSVGSGSSGGLTGQGQSAAHLSIAQSATPC